jgi:hypothetical protein
LALLGDSNPCFRRESELTRYLIVPGAPAPADRASQTRLAADAALRAELAETLIACTACLTGTFFGAAL